MSYRILKVHYVVFNVSRKLFIYFLSKQTNKQTLFCVMTE